MLKARQAEGHLPDVPIFGDVQEFSPLGHSLEYAKGVVAGFPCQAGSSILFMSASGQGVCKAGSMKGLQDSRSGLVSEVWASGQQNGIGERSLASLRPSPLWAACQLQLRFLRFRSFIWLENVANLLNDRMCDIMDWLIQDRVFSKHE